jgi:hypothetical protein
MVAEAVLLIAGAPEGVVHVQVVAPLLQLAFNVVDWPVVTVAGTAVGVQVGGAVGAATVMVTSALAVPVPVALVAATEYVKAPAVGKVKVADAPAGGVGPALALVHWYPVIGPGVQFAVSIDVPPGETDIWVALRVQLGATGAAVVHWKVRTPPAETVPLV